MSKKNKPRYKKWYKYLIGFLVWLIIACLLFFGFMFLDSVQPDGSGGDQPGHRVPVFTILGAILLAAITVLIFIRDIIKIIKSIKYYKDLETVSPGGPTHEPGADGPTHEPADGPTYYE